MEMTLIEKLDNDFKEAYKNKQFSKKDFLGLVRGEATKQSKTPSDAEVIKTLKAFEKSLLSVLEANSTKDVQPEDWNEKDELSIVQSYLPKQMTEAEIESKVNELVSGGASNIGQIMGAFKGLEADMRVVKEKADAALKS
jgi:uncharacterized protein YqeY